MKNLFVYLGFATTSISAQIPIVGDDEAIFFTEENFEGKSLKLKIGQFSIPDGDFKNHIRSAILGKNTKVSLTRDLKVGESDWDEFTDGRGPMISPVMPQWEDEITDINVEKKDDTPQIALFRDHGCNFGYIDYWSTGFKADMSVSTVGDNNLSAIIVPEGMGVTLFTEPNFKGESKTIIGPSRQCNGLENFPEYSLSSAHFFKADKPEFDSIGEWVEIGTATVNGDY